MSPFAHRNLNGCPTAVQTHCYKGLLCPVLEYASVVWDPHQQHLKSTLEMVQQQSARRILHDSSPTSSASALVTQRQLEKLQSRRTSDKVCMMYKIMNSLVDVNPTAGLLEPRIRNSRGHKYQLQVPKLQNRQMPAFILPISNSTLELCPHRSSISCDCTCLQNCTHRWDGRMRLIKINICDFFKPVFNSTAVTTN